MKISKRLQEDYYTAMTFAAVGRIIWEIVRHPKAFQEIVDATNKAVSEMDPLLHVEVDDAPQDKLAAWAAMNGPDILTEHVTDLRDEVTKLWEAWAEHLAGSDSAHKVTVNVQRQTDEGF